MQHVARLPIAAGASFRFPPLSAIAAVLALWRQREHTRRALAALDARALADIGLSENDRRRECARWFWE
jgi:uncharacterized protein YjiS (DUF1127 family)